MASGFENEIIEKRKPLADPVRKEGAAENGAILVLLAF